MSITRTLPFVLLGFATPALADDVQPAPAPSFPHLGPDGRSSEASVGLAIGIPTSDGFSGHLFGFRFDGQGVDPRTGLGGYVSLETITFTGDADSYSALGGIEIGGLYHVQGSDQVDVGFRLGVVLPTVPDDNDDAFANAIGSLVQNPSDLATGAPKTTTLRLSATPTWHQDDLYARADLGLDKFVTGDGTDTNPYVHADFAVGYAPKPVGGALKLQTLCTTDSDVDDRCINLVALSAQIAAGPRGIATVGISKPFGDGSSGESFDDFVNLEAGFRARF